ncbi:hypothetical protein [Streptomyces sp. NBC_01296]|uniref:hypothetical protein n=1 Tax=Streptomyces sp. NBC_01296 TaxID=2903816 RepID=UPI002E1497FA|nr:hypothetical protein OG299_00525 [Streptomyces sp. NBC_01296]
MTVAEVPAEEPSAGVAGLVRTSVAGSIAPHRAEGIRVEVLAPGYQQILAVLAAPEAAYGIRAKQLTVQLGWQTTATGVEGVRSQVKRLTARGWAAEPRPNVFGAVRPSCRLPWDESVPAASAHDHGHRPQHHRLVHGRQGLVVADQAA